MSGCALGLIALGVGYLVFLNASKEKGNLRMAGRIIGAVIIVVSVLGAICAVKCKMGGGTCPMMGDKMMCPISAKTLAEAPQQ